ncbi:MAG: hypothetical protein ACE5JN_15690 [Candidatus Methylomirabilia bacterium]
MTRRIDRIEYRRGMLETGAKADDLPVTAWQGPEVPEDVRSAIQEERVLDLGGVFGHRDGGDPIEYDQLRLILADAAVVEIEFFNRGITLFVADDEKHRRIHRVLCKLDRLSSPFPAQHDLKPRRF